MADVVAGPESGTTVLYELTATTATHKKSVVAPLWAKGALILVNSTAITASPIITITMEAMDADGSYNEVYWTAAATITTATDTSWLFYPTSQLTANKELDVTETIVGPIPRDFQLTFTHTDADSITYSVMIQWLP